MRWVCRSLGATSPRRPSRLRRNPRRKKARHRIWMVQFMKAMRDESGEIVRNAHLLGFFRRICKLLYLRTKHVFVFDGGTPALKRRTLIARLRQRDNAQVKVRKTAEKLLLNHLRAIKLREIAKDLQSQKQKQQDAKKRRILYVQPGIIACSQMKEAMEKRSSRDKQDEMLVAYTDEVTQFF